MRITQQYLSALGFEVVRQRSNEHEITIMCPQCDDATGNRSVSVKNFKTNCWKCGNGGNFYNWARRLGYNVSKEDFVSSVPLNDLLSVKPEVRSILPVVANVKLPEGFTPIKEAPKSVYTRLIAEMAVRKNLIKEDFEEAGCGFTSQHPLWEPFAIFPVTEYGATVYYQGRMYSDEPGDRTKKFPSNAEVKYGARYWIYNIDEARKSKAPTLLVVESVLNVLSLRWYLREKGIVDVVPVAVFKHKVSQEQFFKIARIESIKEICLLFDHDAIAASWGDAAKFANKFSITVAEMPAGKDNKRLDPNDDVVLAWKCFNKRQDYSRGNVNVAKYHIGYDQNNANAMQILGESITNLV